MDCTAGNTQSLATASAKAEALMFPCAASLAFQEDVMKEDFAGPFP